MSWTVWAAVVVVCVTVWALIKRYETLWCFWFRVW